VGDGDGLGGIQCAPDVILIDHAARDARHAARIKRGDMRPGQADQG
jgi:hypothetical protein